MRITDCIGNTPLVELSRICDKKNVRLLAQPEERRRLGQNAQKFAQQYDWRVVIPRFDDVYAALLQT